MIKRLDLTELAHRRAQWPTSVPEDGQLFSRRPPLRQMVVMLDAELERPITGHQWRPELVDQPRLLSELLSSDLIRTYRYADSGPPPDVRPQVRPGGVEVYPGWVVVGKNDSGIYPSVVFSDSATSCSMGSVMGNVPTVAAADLTTDAYSTLSEDQARVKRQADALAAQVAIQGLRADLYVTERDFLHKRGGYSTSGVTVCSPEDALPLVGVYLRTQGEFPVLGRFHFGRGLFYWVGTRELLPASWRWLSACGQHSSQSGDESALLLASSLLQRVERALEARDQLYATLNQKQDNDLRDAALADLDAVLVSFMAGFDIVARVAHLVLGIQGKDYQAGWQKKDRNGWWEQVRAAAPSLADVVATGSQGDNVLTIVRLLRNSVHGAALQGIAYVKGRGIQQTLVGLPERDRAALHLAMQACGGRDWWGIHPSIPGRTHLDPGVFVERLFETGVPLLDELMRLTPVERLAGVNLLPRHLVAPSGGQGNPFEPWMRQSIRWQLGL